MKKIVQFAIGNPVTVLMVVCAILLLGKISYDRLGVDLLPEIENPKLFVELEAGNKPPQEIEKEYIEQIEASAIRQNKVLEVASEIQSGSARVMVKYDWGKNMDDAYIELQKAINPMLRKDGIDNLKITQHDANSDPIVTIAIYNDKINDMAELRKLGENYIRSEFIRVDGIAEVLFKGVEYNEMRIKTNPYKLEAFGLTVNQIANKITNSNQVISGGRVSDNGINYIVKGKSSFENEQDFMNMIVGYKAVTKESTSTNNLTDLGKAPIHLGEVADISFENTPPTNIVRLNGRRCMGMYIYKERAFNTVKAVKGIEKKLDEIDKSLPGYHFEMVSNQGKFINNAINDVKQSALLGIFLAVLVLFLFLRSFGTTLIISISIPISIVATFSLMYFGELTLNIMTLGGLALGAGMLVDNAIVVIESIFRLKEKGLSIAEAAIEGTSQVGAAITASTLTTIVVFLPIVYLHGASGELFKDQAWTVTFSLLSSLFVAIFVIPMLFFHIFKNLKKSTKSSKHLVQSVQIKGYSAFLEKLLEKRGWVIACSFVLLILSFFILKDMGSEFMPEQEANTISMNVKLPEGTKLERTNKTIAEIENVATSFMKDSTSMIFSYIGNNDLSTSNTFEGENTANIKIYLGKNDTHALNPILEAINRLASNNQNLEININNDATALSSLLSDDSSPITVEIKGENLDRITELSTQVIQKIKTIPSIYNITSTNEQGAPQIDIIVNKEVAGMNEISSSEIANQVKAYLEGKDAGKIEDRGQMKSIVIKLPELSLHELGLIPIKFNGKTYLLQEIAFLKESFAPKQIYRRNQHRICKINAQKRNDASLDKIAHEIYKQTEEIELPNDYQIKVTGQEELRKESMNSLAFALLLSIILVYMVLASQFESLLHPFTILLTIPLAFVGAVFLLWITGTTLNIIGVIGIIMLCGIAVNNSILLVDRINQLKQDLPLKEAIISASNQRIRPILMTTLTTILALVPMAINFGDASSLRLPLALSVIGGLITSTMMSLMVIPCVYYYFETLKRKVLKK